MAGKQSDEEFSRLTIKDNIIDTGSRSISIRNISTVGVSKIFPYRKVAVVVLIVGAAILFSALSNRDQGLLLFLGIILMFGALGIYSINRTFLVISTNDGSSSRFYNENFDFMKRVKTAIDDRINNPNETSQFTVNFNKGSIEQMSVENMGGIAGMTAETVVSGSPGAQVASHSPGAQVGDGNTMEIKTTYVDYSHYLPSVEKIREAVPSRRPDLNIEDKLDELIDLMKLGSPTNEDKSRVEQLALNLAQILQAYPPMVRLFNDIAALVVRFF
jgi:hypothetical protein